jgi:SAM-dependent methyltransferase
VRGSLAQGGAILADHEDRFVWTWYGSRERRDRMLSDALEAFRTGLDTHPATYVPGALPELPYAADAFDLALCSHLLFTWSDLLDEEWPERALLELLRVARQVRVFPLVVQGTAEPVPFLPRTLDRLRALGHRADVVQVPYEFHCGANAMLGLNRG